MPNIPYYYRVRLTDKLAPMKVCWSFPDGKQKSNHVMVYYSTDHKEPSNQPGETYEPNKTRFTLNGIINPKTQKLVFDKPFLYICVIA